MDASSWDDRYSATDLVWSAGPNQFVAEVCAPLPPGRAIDLAAGEARNTLWLAEQGWDATAVDFSAVALDKARRIAARRGLAITTVEADLTGYTPDERAYDLVLIAYLQIRVTELATVVGRAAAAVAPGGRLLLIGHDVSNIEHGYGGPSDPAVLTDAAAVVEAIGPQLTVERAEVADREVSTDDGPRTAKDTLVLAHRD
ncbi:MAG: class I SAM-dependent methyltransferase [Acidimicrobiales bacterium]